MSDQPGHRDLDVFDGRLRQPDQRSCGAAVLVLARMLLDDGYADLVVGGQHPTTGHRLLGDLTVRFQSEVLAMHRRVTGVVDVAGRLQAPWPRALGTPPWAVARQLSATACSHLPSVEHAITLAAADPGDVFDQVARISGAGRPVPAYVGNRWLPRHVVLFLGPVGSTGDRLRCYDPATGRVVEVTRDAFARHRLGLSGWDRPWLAVLPR